MLVEEAEFLEAALVGAAQMDCESGIGEEVEHLCC
jgi:hypothetical protein